jgi:hypothetical protein
MGFGLTVSLAWFGARCRRRAGSEGFGWGGRRVVARERTSSASESGCTRRQRRLAAVETFGVVRMERATRRVFIYGAVRHRQGGRRTRGVNNLHGDTGPAVIELIGVTGRMAVRSPGRPVPRRLGSWSWDGTAQFRQTAGVSKCGGAGLRAVTGDPWPRSCSSGSCRRSTHISRHDLGGATLGPRWPDPSSRVPYIMVL